MNIKTFIIIIVNHPWCERAFKHSEIIEVKATYDMVNNILIDEFDLFFISIY